MQPKSWLCCMQEQHTNPIAQQVAYFILQKSFIFCAFYGIVLHATLRVGWLYTPKTTQSQQLQGTMKRGIINERRRED